MVVPTNVVVTLIEKLVSTIVTIENNVEETVLHKAGKMRKKQLGIIFVFFSFTSLTMSNSYALEKSITEEVDCSDITIELDSDTTDINEKLQEMDDAFYDSLSEFEHCSESSSSSSSSSGGGGGSAGGGGGGSSADSASSSSGGVDGNGSQMQGSSQSDASSPSKGISGTEKASESNQSASGNQESAEESATQTDSLTSGNVEKNDKFSDNGKLPEDIPPADNDSVVEAQLRQAAIAEKDPQKKKKLWNEYRRYKGLSEK